MWRAALGGLTLVAFALRIHALAAVPLRWDEGWSVALAALPTRQMLSITAQDVHPPIYYLALAPWQAFFGAGEFAVRFPSVLEGVVAIPLAGAAARAWWPRRGDVAGLAAAAYACSAPLLVYYAGVARMYALTAPFLLLAAWGLARLVRPTAPPGARLSLPTARPTPKAALAAAVAGSAGAVLTFYYAGLALAGLYVAALLLGLGGRRRYVVAAGIGAALIAAPWLVYAAGQLAGRVGERTAGFALTPNGVPSLAWEGLKAALFAQRGGVAAALAPVAVIAAGAALAGRRRGRFLVAALPALTVLVGVAAGTQAHMFAARYVIPAVPFIALGIGWAVAGALPDRRRDQRRWDGRLRGGLRPTGRPRRTAGRLAGSLLAVSFAVVAFLPVVAPLRTEVYARALEVTDPYDPTADWQALHDAASHRDIAVFNILSLAGFYERYRTPSDPAWTYAQLWDPVHEPLNRARQRVSLAARRADRIWLVLYKGTYAEDSAALKAWADETFYPADSNWSEDRLYQSYIDAVPDQGSSPNASFGHGVRLEDTTFTTSSLPGHGVALQLQWHASRTPDADGKVFVHLYAPDGTLVAQHDGFPAFDTRPPTTWRAGEDVRDRIGLYVPPGTQGPLRLAVGIYDPSTGARWKLPNGADHVDVGEVNPAP